MKNAIRFFLLTVLLSAVYANSQELTWSTDWAEPAAVDVGGSSGRPGIASAQFHGQLWIAYTSTSVSSSSSRDYYVKIAHNTGGTTLSFDVPTKVPQEIQSSGYAVSNQNPALAVLDGSLYLAYTDSYGNTLITSTLDGLTWTKPAGINSDAIPTVYGPTLAVDPNNTSKLYVGMMSSTSYTPVICTVSPDIRDASNTTSSCFNYTNLHGMNFNPGMAFYNGHLYMVYEDRGNNHCVYGYVGNPVSNTFIPWNPIGCNQQTSTQPSVAVYNGYLYIAFGSNDGNRKFLVLGSADGSTLPYSRALPQFMNGPADLLPVTELTTGSASFLANFYAWHGQVRYMYGR